MYGIINSGKLFTHVLTEWLLESGLIKSQCHMSTYYKYAQYGTKIVVLSYVDGCVYWYTFESIGKWFVDTLGKILYMNFLGFAHWIISIITYQM